MRLDKSVQSPYVVVVVCTLTVGPNPVLARTSARAALLAGAAEAPSHNWDSVWATRRRCLVSAF